MKYSLIDGLKNQLNGSKVGFEKESLRIYNSKIASSEHPFELGSPLFNKYITTDFSESQLELITPPKENKKDALLFLDEIHHFVSANIKDETLWPFSMPPKILNEKEIPIAKYGSSNKAKLKELYRIGLANRYGRMMQAISGFHYNFSAKEDLLGNLLSYHSKYYKNKSDAYFNLLKNIYRFNWIIIYLTGASPIVPQIMVKGEPDILQKFSKDTYFHPYATSLRMSEFGYKNSVRDNFRVSFQSIEDYILDIQNAAKTNSNFSNISKKSGLTFLYENNERYAQINPNKLQIDDEYYALARLKSASTSRMSATEKIKNSGVDFIELRSLDINPFAISGIDIETIYFLEILLLYCLINPSPEISKKDFEIFELNDSKISIKGRDPYLKLIKDRKEISAKEWGLMILENLIPIAETLDENGSMYKKCLSAMKEKILHPEITISAKILQEIESSGLDFYELGLFFSEKNKKYYSKIKKSDNRQWDLFANESEQSLVLKNMEETRSKTSFKEYLRDNKYS